VGLVFNIRFTEILDFILGWTTYDLCGDDGGKVSKWPWQPVGARNSPYRPPMPF